MAFVKSISFMGYTENKSKEPTYMELGWAGGNFSIKTYRSSDPARTGSPSQNLVLDLKRAIILRDELDRYISNH